MIVQTTHTTRVFDTDGAAGIQVELQLDLGPAEPDVGIPRPYIDNWTVIGVEGNTDETLCLATEQTILDEYDDEAFIQKLYDEGAADQ